MPASPDDIGKMVNEIRDVLHRIDKEEIDEAEKDDSIRTGPQAEILPRSLNVEAGVWIDEYCVLSSDKDSISAVLTILPDRREGYEIPTQRLNEEMKQMGIVFGIRKGNVEKAVQLARGDPGLRIDLIVAQGRRPVHGTDAVVTFHCDIGTEGAVIRKGDLLIEKHLGKLWRDGCNILGKPIPAHHGEETTIVLGQDVISSEDGLQVYAACDGVARWDNGRIWVEPEDRDGYVTIETSPDLLSATMCLYPPSGKGRALDDPAVIQALSDGGVTYGAKRDAIIQAVKRVSETGEPALDLLAAEGSPPEKGEDGRIEIVVDFQPKDGRCWINSDGSVDFFKLRRIDSALEGEVVARIVLPTVGREGCTVTGERLPGIEGKRADVRLGDNVVFSEDGSEIRATISGQFHFEEGTISVRQVHVVDGDIDFSTGSLELIGDLVVRGSVLDGFEIRAKGSVTIEGTVGSSVVLAGRHINIGRGVFGKQRGMVRAGGDVAVAFLQNATVYAGGDLHVGNQILNSRAFAKGKVTVSSGKGLIVGGRVQAGKGIEARIIGSGLGSRTEVITGVDWEIEERVALLREQVQKMEENLGKLDGITRQASQMLQDPPANLSPEQRQLIAAVLAKRQTMERELVQLKKEQRETRAKVFLPMPADIVATNILHVDVRCTIRDAKLRIRKPAKCARVTYDKEEDKLLMSGHLG